MTHKITFYPEGNADTCLVEPENGEILLFDYADRHGDDEEARLRVDLSAALQEKLEARGRDGFDVVASRPRRAAPSPSCSASGQPCS